MSTIFFKYFTVFCNFSKRLPKRFVMCGWNYYKKLSTGCGNISPTVKRYSLKLRYICGQMRYTPACAICPSDEKIIPDVPSLPLEGSETATAVLNDNPVGCQTRGVTEPQRDRCQQS